MRTFNEEENTRLLVRRYEEMIRNNDLGFLDAQSLERLANYYDEKRQIKDALKVVDYAMSLYAYSSTFFLKNAQLLFKSGKLKKAIFFLDKAAVLDSSEMEIYLLRAEICASQGKFEEAEEILFQAKATHAGGEVDHMHMAMANLYEKMDNYDKVFTSLREALLANPKNIEALERIWLACEFTQRYHESIGLHQKVVDEEPYSHLAWYNLGHAYYSLGQFEKAAEAYEFVLVIEENFEFAYMDCGECYFMLQLYEKAIEIYKDALVHTAPTSKIYTEIGHCYEEMGDFLKAKRYYLSALELEATDDIPHYRIGECFSKESQWISAIGSYERAIECNESCADYYAALALAYYNIDDHAQASATFLKACDLAPDECDRWLQYAMFLQHIDLPGSALEILEEADIYCAGSKLPYFKAACLFTMGNRQEAFVLLKSALTASYDEHGWLYECSPVLMDDQEVLMTINEFKKS